MNLMVPAFPRKNEEQQSKLQACHSTPQQDFKKLQKYLANDTNAASACFAMFCPWTLPGRR
jgi:hypothetical protein